MKLDYREVNNMAAPPKEMYDEALRRVAYLGDAIIRERKRREKLINKLCASQDLLNSYQALINDAKEVVQKYEIYQEVKSGS